MFNNKPACYIITAAAGLLASLFTLRMGDMFTTIKLPLFFPPVWVLPIGWTAALICLASSAGSAENPKITTSLYVSLGIMVCWSALFFRMDAPLAAAVCGLLLTGIWLNLKRFISEDSQHAGKVMRCCCAWAGYMVYLNLGILLMN